MTARTTISVLAAMVALPVFAQSQSQAADDTYDWSTGVHACIVEDATGLQAFKSGSEPSKIFEWTNAPTSFFVDMRVCSFAEYVASKDDQCPKVSNPEEGTLNFVTTLSTRNLAVGYSDETWEIKTGKYIGGSFENSFAKMFLWQDARFHYAVFGPMESENRAWFTLTGKCALME